MCSGSILCCCSRSSHGHERVPKEKTLLTSTPQLQTIEKELYKIWFDRGNGVVGGLEINWVDLDLNPEQWRS